MSRNRKRKQARITAHTAAPTTKPDTASLREELARPSQTGLRSVWQWRPLASLTPAAVADLLRRASMGDAHDFLIAADDIREKDLHYRAVLQTRTLAVAGLPVDLQPADDSAPAKRAAELVGEALHGLDLPGLVAHLMDAVAKGYAVAEIVWETTGSLWRPREIVPREAHWFAFDRDTGRLLRLVDGSAEGAEIPPYKMIVHAPPLASGIPLLGGVARSAMWAWVFKSYALRDWARFCELFGQPIRVGKYHQGASPDDVAVLRRAAFELGSDAAAVIPQEMVLELVESGSKSASAELYHKLIDYLDRQVSKAVLGQTMTTDDGSSLSQARVHNEVRLDLIAADARAIAATLMRDLVTPLVRLNLGDAPLPTLRLLVEEPEDLAALADQVVKLSQAGLPIPQAWVRDRFGIPEAIEGEAVLVAKVGAGDTAPEAAAPVSQAMRPAGSAQAQGPAQDIAAQAPELLADRLEIEAEPAWGEIMDTIKKLVEEADSLEALRDALLSAFGDLPTDRLAEVMAMGFAAADLAGRFAVEAEASQAEPRRASAARQIALPQVAVQAEIKMDALAEALSRIAQPAQVQVDVHVPPQPAPVMQVAAPEVTVQAPAPEVTVNVQAPEVRVENAVQPAPTVIVPTHPKTAVQTVERDEMGEVVKTVIHYDPEQE